MEIDNVIDTILNISVFCFIGALIWLYLKDDSEHWANLYVLRCNVYTFDLARNNFASSCKSISQERMKAVIQFFLKGGWKLVKSVGALMGRATTPTLLWFLEEMAK